MRTEPNAAGSHGKESNLLKAKPIRADGQDDQASGAEGLKRCVKGGARSEESLVNVG